MGTSRRQFIETATLASSVLLHAKSERATVARPDFSSSRIQSFLQAPIVFCRVADSDGALFLQARALLGNPAPLRWFRDGNHLTVHFPDFVLAYELVAPGRPEGVWFHGADSTLRVRRESAHAAPVKS